MVNIFYYKKNALNFYKKKRIGLSYKFVAKNPHACVWEQSVCGAKKRIGFFSYYKTYKNWQVSTIRENQKK